MFAELSDSVSRHGKIILAIWIVAVLVLIPPAVESMHGMGYGLTDMGGSGSTEADGTLSAYFDDPDIDQSRIPLIVVSYDSRDGYRQLQGDEESGIPGYVEYLRSRFLGSADWLKRIDPAYNLVEIRGYGDSSKGAVLLGLAYSPLYSDSDIASDTKELRRSVSEYTDDFIYELYEDRAHFDVYVTGNNAVAEDLSDELYLTVLISAAAVVILTLILTGLFFRSAVTALIVAASMAPPSIATAAFIFGFDSMSEVFFIVGVLTLIGVLALSFTHCIYMISVYRTELLTCRDRDSALRETVVRTGRPILSTSICLLACTVALAAAGQGVISSFGVCMSVGTVMAVLSSLTVPASFMNVTRNELFWTVDPDRRGSPVFVRRFHDRMSDLFRGLMKSISDLTTVHGRAVLAVSVCLVVCCAGYLVDADGKETARYDMSDSMSVGESRTGLDILKGESDGGILHPLHITASFVAPVADIEYDRAKGLYRLEWRSGDALSSMTELASEILESDRENVSRTLTVMTWESFKESVSSDEDPRAMVSEVSDYLGSIDGTYRIAFDSVIAKLLLAGFSYQEIVDSCEPYIDYGLNESLGLIGYEMLSDRSIAVTHLQIVVYTCDSPLSMRSIETIGVIEDIIGGSDSATFFIGGAGMAYKEFIESADTGFWMSAPAVVIALLIVLAASMSIGTASRSVATTLSGAIISLAVTDYFTGIVWGSGSVTVKVAMTIVCVMMGVWFNAIQENRIEYCRKKGMGWREASAEVLTTLQPVVVITAVVLAASFMAFCVSDIQMLGQLGFSVAAAILVDAFFVRTFMSPSIWSMRWKGNGRKRIARHR